MRNDKFERRFGAFFIGWFVLCAVVGLAMLGLGAWAVIELVQWVTTQ